ncbi:MAG TPA: hypothetical protein VK479_01070 [Micropepsaceae bacterium]|nr:hypothetical protein [Micropepsaceae bacterium]
MTTFTSLHPLKYIAEALSQMAATLRDFGMVESAELLEKAKVDINQKLTEKPRKENVQN